MKTIAILNLKGGTDKVPESTFDRQPIVCYSPGSAAAQDYRRWVREYIGAAL